MNDRRMKRVGFILTLLGLTLLFACSGGGDRASETLYYAIESRGTVYGWQEVEISRLEDGETPLLLMKESGRSISSALGAEINSESRSEYRLDARTWALVSVENLIDQGSLKLSISAKTEGDAVEIKIEPGQGSKRVSVGEGVLFENPVYFPHLTRDFGQGGLTEKSYKMLDLIDRKVYPVSYSLSGTEELDLAGQKHTALVLDSYLPEVGLKLRLWVDETSGLLLKLVTPRSTVTLADKSVKRRLRRVNLDKDILAPANVSIADIAFLSRLKVSGILEPVGNEITAESLNVPGQTFEGTVVNNRVEGLFEIEHARYDGRNAPPFPPDFSRSPLLAPFLAPEDFIESDDPVLRNKALELVEGSPDSWEAAKRLSRWVAENIGYDIPGGATARNTFDLREGECGAHSRLFAAFARAAGIPARVVWGCMYIPSQGGSFGQHAWNEIYMGEEAGWIPLDTTVREIDFADSGHIRLGILASAHIAWNPKEMEILDFEAGPQKSGDGGETAGPEKLQPLLGNYRGNQGRTFTILVQEGGLAVDIPERGILGLRDSGESDKWVLAAAPEVAFAFTRDDDGRVSGFTLTNPIRIPKLEDPAAETEGIPAEFLPYCGRYPLPLDKREATVGYRRGHLTIRLPGEEMRLLSGPDDSGFWGEINASRRFSFVKDEAGTVRAMIIHEIIRCPKLR